MLPTVALERPDTPEALALLADLDAYYLTLYPAESNYTLDVSGLLQGHVRFFVARVDGAAVGCAAVCLFEGYSEIKRMYVRPDRRGNGIAQRLMDALFTATRAAGLSLIRLETGISQPEALAFYERSGFQRIGPFGDYPNDPLCLFYERTI